MKKEMIYILVFIICSVLVNADVVINEIMYYPLQSNYFNEWIEIYNNGTESINLTGWSLCDDGLLSGYMNRTASINLNTTMILEPNQYGVITDGGSGTEVYDNFNVSDSSIALHVNSNSMCSTWLNNDEEVIILKDFNTNVIDSVSYNDSWGANGNGKSLELLNPIFDNNISFNWGESLYVNGTPGEQNSIFEPFDEIAPVVNLVYPENNSYLNLNNINFSFNVVDNSEILNCSLYLNNVLNQTNETVLNNTLTYFNVFNLVESVYEWNVNCNDESGNVNISETRLFNVDITDPNIFLSMGPSILEFGIENTTVNFTIIDANLDTSIKNLFWPNGTLYKIFTNNLTLTTQNLTILGNYTVYIWANDSSGRETSNTFDIKVQDTIAPDIYLNYPENNTLLNYNLINFSYNISDLNSIRNCSLIFDDIVNITSEDIINGGINYFNVSNIPEGVYEWNVTCLDSSNNTNSSFNLLNIDLSFPSFNNKTEIISTDFIIINFTTNEESNITISYGTNLNLTENISESEFLFNHSIKIENLTSSTFYYYNISFCDIANNCNLSETYNFTTSTVVVISGNGGDSGGDSGGSSSGISNYLPITDLSDTQITLYSWSTTYFILNNEQHNLKIKTIENDTLTLTISSEPFDVILKVDETKDVDVDQNGMNDLRITLISIEGSQAVLYFEELEEVEVLGNIIEIGNVTEDSNLITGAVVSNIEANPFVGGVIIIVIIVLGLLFYFIFKKEK